MSRRYPRLEHASLIVIAGMVVLSVAGGFLPAHSSMGWFALALRSFLLTTFGIVSIGLLIALPLGIVAASGPRSADGTLAAATDLVGVVPAALLLAIVAANKPSPLALVCTAGLVRGIGFAWMLRSELTRAAAEERDIVARNLGHGPLLVFFRERLVGALGPVLTGSSLTGAWAVAIEAVAVRAGFSPLTHWPSFGAALGKGEHRLVATLAVALGSAALYVLARSISDRLAEDAQSEPFALVRK